MLELDPAKVLWVLAACVIMFFASASLFALALLRFQFIRQIGQSGFEEGMLHASKFLNEWATQKRTENRPQGHILAHQAEQLAVELLYELDRKVSKP
jgi:hypothetical protein